MKELTYEETIELEKNIKIKNEANELYKQFLQNVILNPSTFKDGRFLLWKDPYNSTYLKVHENIFIFQCRFLHEKYDVKITPEHLFEYIKNDYRGLEHFKALVSK